MTAEMPADAAAAAEAIWRIEGHRIVASLTKMVGDLGWAEDLAQDALADALLQWPQSGIPANAGAWLTTVAKRKAIDRWRRDRRLDERHRALAERLEQTVDEPWESIEDDVLRLVFIACHPVLSRESQIALTLKVVGGLSTQEIGRLFLVPVATVQQRIVRAKRSLATARAPFATPEAGEWDERLQGVLSVIYLVFTAGYAAGAGSRWIRAELAGEALRLGRSLASMLPREPEVLGLLALMELQASHFAAREAPDGVPILLDDQDRNLWDRSQIRRGQAALKRADGLGRGRGSYGLQAAIAQCHAVAASVDTTDWHQIVLLYEILGRIAPSPIVELNRAVAVSQATGPAAALAVIDRMDRSGPVVGGPLHASVRGQLLALLGRAAEARVELTAAWVQTANEQQRRVLRAKLEALEPGPATVRRPPVPPSDARRP